MDPYIVLGQKDLIFHGIWKAHYKVSDGLIRTIAANLASTPARLCKLVLTSAGLRLNMLDGRKEKTDQVSFDSLRDVGPNQYYRKCLLIIYVTDTKTFNVMACSSNNAKDIDDLSTAYRNHKQQLLRHRIRSDPQGRQARSDQAKPRFLSEGHQPKESEYRTQARLFNGVASKTLTNGTVLAGDCYGSSQSSELSSGTAWSTSDVAEVEDVFTAAVSTDVFHDLGGNLGKRVTFDPDVQTLQNTLNPSRSSNNSATSFQALKDDVHVLTEEIKNITGLLDRSHEISAAEEFPSRRGAQENEYTMVWDSRTIQPVNVSDGSRGQNKRPTAAQTDGQDGGNDLGSTQASQDGKSGRRYFKNQLTTATTSANKEKVEALRKRSSSAGPRVSSSSGSNSETSTSPLGSSGRSYVPSTMAQLKTLTGPTSSSPSAVKKSVVSGSTTVVKPIENVYPGRVGRRPDRGRGPHVIVFNPTGQSLM